MIDLFDNSLNISIILHALETIVKQQHNGTHEDEYTTQSVTFIKCFSENKWEITVIDNFYYLQLPRSEMIHFATTNTI